MCGPINSVVPLPLDLSNYLYKTLDVLFYFAPSRYVTGASAPASRYGSGGQIKRQRRNRGTVRLPNFSRTSLPGFSVKFKPVEPNIEGVILALAFIFYIVFYMENHKLCAEGQFKRCVKECVTCSEGFPNRFVKLWNESSYIGANCVLFGGGLTCQRRRFRCRCLKWLGKEEGLQTARRARMCLWSLFFNIKNSPKEFFFSIFPPFFPSLFQASLFYL